MLRVLVLLLALILPVASAHPQPSTLPEPCRAAAAAARSLFELEQRKEELEFRINDKGTEAPAQLRRNQEQLLEVIFQIECEKTKQRLGASDVIARRGAIKEAKPSVAEGTVEITTYYATNRVRSSATEPGSVYGSEVAPTLQYGRALVTIPHTHTPGSIEVPRLWRLQRQADPSKHFVLKSVEFLQPDVARKELRGELQASPTKAVLIFVHGYNTGFREAAMRSAQLAHDLKFPGIPFFFSWPSIARVTGYFQDAESAQLSEGAFELLLDDLSSLPASDIYVVAHSMGNRIVAQALKARIDTGKETKHLRELLMAAPDISVDLFRNVIAPKLAALQGTRTTVYASSSDLALRASQAMHGFKRVGETKGGVFVFPGMETIDATSASLIMRGYGHSYLMDNAGVLQDISSIIQKRQAAKARGLSQAGSLPDLYWRLP